MRGLTVAAAALTGGLGALAGTVAGVVMGAAEAASSFDDARIVEVLATAGAVSQRERDQRVLKAWVNLGVGTAANLAAGAIPAAQTARAAAGVVGFLSATGLLFASEAAELAALGFGWAVDAPRGRELADAQLTLDLWRLRGQEKQRHQWRRLGGGGDEHGEVRLEQVSVAYAAARSGQLARLIVDQQVAADFRSFAGEALRMNGM